MTFEIRCTRCGDSHPISPYDSGRALDWAHDHLVQVPHRVSDHDAMVAQTLKLVDEMTAGSQTPAR